MPRQFPAIIREALRSGAADDRLEDAVLREVKLALGLARTRGEEAARESLGEELWLFAEAELQGLKTLLAAEGTLAESGLPARMALHLQTVWADKSASLIGKVTSGRDPVVDGQAVALIFVQEWANKGVVPPVAEVRGLHIRRSVAQEHIREVLKVLIEEGFLTAKEDDTRESVLERRFRAHRIVLARLERAQVVVGGKKWTSPLSPYFRMHPEKNLTKFGAVKAAWRKP